MLFTIQVGLRRDFVADWPKLHSMIPSLSGWMLPMARTRPGTWGNPDHHRRTVCQVLWR
jgi:hypothetical protein